MNEKLKIGLMIDSTNVPYWVYSMIDKITQSNYGEYFDSTNLSNKVADYELVRKMRASILVLGPLIARFKKAKISIYKICTPLALILFNYVEVNGGFITI